MRVDLDIPAIEHGVSSCQRAARPMRFDDLIVAGDLIYLFQSNVLVAVTDEILGDPS